MSNDIWWDYLCPAMANIGPMKRAQSELVALGVDWASAGRILSNTHKEYVDAVYDASARYKEDQ